MTPESAKAWRALAVPFVMTLVVAALLISLGTWQLQRRAWKLGIIERIETRIHHDPISLQAAIDGWRQSHDIDYTRVRLTGRFLHEQERHFYAIVEGQAGWKIITPLRTDSGDIVLVDRGFVPGPLKDSAARQGAQAEGIATLTGLARASQPQGWFTPANDAAANRWFWRDVPGLIASLPPDLAPKAAPFIVEAEAEPQAGAGEWPRAGVTILTIPNRHLEYALTWFALAATLLVVFAAYARNMLATGGESGSDAHIAERGPGV
jgi:surfeit locus 1 family protein